MDGKITDIPNPNKFVPEYPGSCNLIYTIKDTSGTTKDVKVSKTIIPLEYKVLALTSIKPVDILPIIGQVEGGDKNVYSHIEHLRLAEATRVRDMM